MFFMFIRFLPIFRYFMRLTTVGVSATIKALNVTERRIFYAPSPVSWRQYHRLWPTFFRRSVWKWICEDSLRPPS